jgi:hypothetical protein
VTGHKLQMAVDVDAPVVLGDFPRTELNIQVLKGILK